MACEPAAVADEELSDADLAREAGRQISKSDAIIDARVTGYLPGAVVLRPIRVMKGPRLAYYVAEDHQCGTYFPRLGSKVRVLLMRTGIGKERWEAFDPAMGGRLSDYRRLDRIIDLRLRAPRSSDFETIAAAVPPPPE